MMLVITAKYIFAKYPVGPTKLTAWNRPASMIPMEIQAFGNTSVSLMLSDNTSSAIKAEDFKSETGATPISIKLSGITVDLTFDTEPASIQYTGSAMP